MSSRKPERPLLEPHFEHTLGSRLRDAFEFSMYYMMRHMPIDWVSDVGSFIVRQNIKRNRPHIIANARSNLTRLRPELSGHSLDKAVYNFQDNVGRLMAEFAVVHRLYDGGRIEVSQQLQQCMQTVKDEPTLMMVVHTGNWEVFLAMFKAHGLDIVSFAIPPESWAQRVIASKVREDLGVTIIPPDRRGLHRAKAALLAGRSVAIFPDEARHGVTMAPFFGRKPHRKGNLALAAWLAEETGARILLGNCVRRQKARFFLDCLPYFHLPKTASSAKHNSLDNIALLNAKIEPLVRDNLDQWYFLDDALDEII